MNETKWQQLAARVDIYSQGNGYEIVKLSQRVTYTHRA